MTSCNIDQSIRFVAACYKERYCKNGKDERECCKNKISFIELLDTDMVGFKPMLSKRMPPALLHNYILCVRIVLLKRLCFFRPASIPWFAMWHNFGAEVVEVVQLIFRFIMLDRYFVILFTFFLFKYHDFSQNKSLIMAMFDHVL